MEGGSMRSYLELEAALGTRAVHPGGTQATSHLLTQIHVAAGDRALDAGCGSGATARAVASLGVAVAAVDVLPAMLVAASRKRPTTGAAPVWTVQADLSAGLPFADACFDAAWSESVLALVDTRRALADCVRTLRPGGRLVVNERIWRPGMPADEVTRINALSRRCFGLPAATDEPIDRAGWTELLSASGTTVTGVTCVDDVAPERERPLPLKDWLARQLRYLLPPFHLARSLRWRWLARRHRAEWSRLESWIFVAEKRA
jgi:SAM-dependent methyltransferase